jgi:hypothetical protein
MSAVYRTNVYSNICKLFVEFIMYGTEGAHEKKKSILFAGKYISLRMVYAIPCRPTTRN